MFLACHGQAGSWKNKDEEESLPSRILQSIVRKREVSAIMGSIGAERDTHTLARHRSQADKLWDSLGKNTLGIIWRWRWR